LRGVIERLRGHAATIAEELQRHQGNQGGLDAQRRDAEEELSEAEVRHTVGEFSDDEWRRISQESERKLGGLREQLKTVGAEIARLVEVQGLIAAPTKPAAPPPPPPQEQVIERSPPPPPPPAPSQPVAEAPAPKAAPRPTPTRTREPEPAGAVDELAFLKSVGDEPKPAAAARRPSNPGTGASPQGSRAVETAPAPAGKAGAPGVAKTLKCGECGTLNRPTEWYCERCGAELAGI
jgi:outer membrane biosynthesis protein TonB